MRDEEIKYNDLFKDWDDEVRAAGPDECGEKDLGTQEEDNQVQRHNFRNNETRRAQNSRRIQHEKPESEDGFGDFDCGIVWKIN